MTQKIEKMENIGIVLILWLVWVYVYKMAYPVILSDEKWNLKIRKRFFIEIFFFLL